MKTVLATLLVLTATSAFAADNDLAPLGLTDACQAKIMRAASTQCNKDSKDDSAREHVCLYQVSAILRNSSDAGYFTLDFSVTDADEYNYGVSISDKSKCEFKVFSKN